MAFFNQDLLPRYSTVMVTTELKINTSSMEAIIVTIQTNHTPHKQGSLDITVRR